MPGNTRFTKWGFVDQEQDRYGDEETQAAGHSRDLQCVLRASNGGQLADPRKRCLWAAPKSPRTARVVSLLEKLGVEISVFGNASPVSADQYDLDVEFLDGGMHGRTGNYIGGEKGVLLSGKRAVLLVAFELGLRMPAYVLKRQGLEGHEHQTLRSDLRSELDLLRAYRETNYEVRLPDGDLLVLRHGQPNPKLDKFIEEEHAEAPSWVFITAWNPESLQLPEKENAAAMRRLKAELKKRGYPHLEAIGRGTGNSWEEPSLIAFGPSGREAKQLGVQFRQNAVVVGRQYQDARVLWCYRSLKPRA